MFDTDGSGYIEFKELKAMIEALGYDLTEREVKNMIKTVDKDSSGNTLNPTLISIVLESMYISFNYIYNCNYNHDYCYDHKHKNNNDHDHN